MNIQRSSVCSVGIHLLVVVLVVLGVGQRAIVREPLVLQKKVAGVQPTPSPQHELLHVAAVLDTDVQAWVQHLEAEEQAKKQVALQQRHEQEQTTQELQKALAAERARADAMKQKHSDQQKASQKKEEGMGQLKNEVSQLKERLAEAEKAAQKKRAQEEKKWKEQEMAVREAQQAAEAARQALSAEQALRQMMLQEAQAKETEQAIQRTLLRIQERVSQAWMRPVGVPDALVCEIEVQLNQEGGVHAARVLQGSGHVSFDRSAVAAVYQASPLPLPETSEARALLRQFTFVFEPGGA